MYQAKDITILVVDDESSIVEFLELGLQNEGYQVLIAQNGIEAVNLAKEFHPQIAILDIMMPGMDGFEVCKMLKMLQPIAVIMLTARDEVEDRVKGLTIGADDYMMKPFSFQELLARIHARIRNQFPSLLNEIIAGPLRINDARKEIAFNGEILTLSTTEYELLKYLVINQGIVLSKAKILEQVWGYDFGGQENIVEVYIRSIREKLNDTNHQVIRTIRGSGYRVDLP